MQLIQLYSAQSANTRSSTALWRGGYGLFDGYGTFGGGTLTLEYSPDSGTTWITDPNLTFTANNNHPFWLPYNVTISANLTGSSGASLNAKVTVLHTAVN